MRIAAVLVCAASFLTAVSTANAADAARGKITFMSQCAGCHVVIANARDSMGPNLFGVVGRKAGGKPGYTYSDAMKKSGITWGAGTLKTFVMNPMDTVEGTNMMFAGIHNPAQADDVVAYLGTLK